MCAPTRRAMVIYLFFCVFKFCLANPHLFPCFHVFSFLLFSFSGAVKWRPNLMFFFTPTQFCIFRCSFFDDACVRQISMGEFFGRAQFTTYFWVFLFIFPGGASWSCLHAMVISAFWWIRMACKMSRRRQFSTHFWHYFSVLPVSCFRSSIRAMAFSLFDDIGLPFGGRFPQLFFIFCCFFGFTSFCLSFEICCPAMVIFAFFEIACIKQILLASAIHNLNLSF